MPSAGTRGTGSRHWGRAGAPTARLQNSERGAELHAGIVDTDVDRALTAEANDGWQRSGIGRGHVNTGLRHVIVGRLPRCGGSGHLSRLRPLTTMGPPCPAGHRAIAPLMHGDEPVTNARTPVRLPSSNIGNDF